MFVEVRIYKRWDTDLLSLLDAGYPLFLMIRDAIISYANGIPLHYYIDEPIDFDLNGKKTVRSRFEIPKNESNAIYLLKNIKHGYRNTFCKVLLRNALVGQALAGFLTNDVLFDMDKKNKSAFDPHMYPNLIFLSTTKGIGTRDSLFDMLSHTTMGGSQSIPPVSAPVSYPSPVYTPAPYAAPVVYPQPIMTVPATAPVSQQVVQPVSDTVVQTQGNNVTMPVSAELEIDSDPVDDTASKSDTSKEQSSETSETDDQVQGGVSGTVHLIEDTKLLDLFDRL